MLEKISPSSYRIQKLPFLRGLGHPGTLLKENAACMTSLPLTAILYFTPNGTHSQFGPLEGTRALHALHPLQKWLGVQQPGPYQQTQLSTKHAFTPLKSM